MGHSGNEGALLTAEVKWLDRKVSQFPVTLRCYVINGFVAKWLLTQESGLPIVEHLADSRFVAMNELGKSYS